MYFSGDIGNYAGINAEAETTDEVMKYLEEHDLDPSIDLYKMSHHSNSEVNNTDYAIDNLKPKNCVVTNGRKRVNSNKEKFGRAIDRVNKYIEKYGGKMCFTAAGTTVANVTRDDGDLTVKQMPNHWTSGGKKI